MLAVSRQKTVIYIRDSETRAESVFNTSDGTRIRGNLDIAPEEVLFLAWSQTQHPNLSESKLRAMFNAQSSNGVTHEG